jgi:UPF0716 protein FxsA
MLLPLVLLFIVVPIAELAVIIQVGQEIGVWWTIAILVADSILGSLLMRSQGRAVWRRFNATLQAGRPPAREVADGVLVIFGGALLLTPGFITDIFGLILLIPPTRAGVRAFLSRVALGRLSMGPRAAMWSYGRVRDGWGRRPAPGAGPGGGPAAGRDPFGREDPIEGTAHEVRDGDQLPPAGTESPPGRPPPGEEPPK